MKELTYKIHVEERKLFLKLDCGIKKNIYFSDFKKSSDKELLEKLVSIQRREKSGPFDTLTFNQIEIPPREIKDILLLASKTKRLELQKRRIHFDPKGAKVLFEVIERTPKGATCRAFIKEGDLIPLEKCLLVQAKPLIFLTDDMAGSLNTDISSKHLFALSKGEAFIRHFDEEVEYEEVLESTQPAVRPLVILKDLMGLNVSLWAEYSSSKFLFSDLSSLERRNREEEMGFERDLLELGYKRLGESYVISMEEGMDALRLLIELGWRVLDRREKPIVLQTNTLVDLHENEYSVTAEFGGEKGIVKGSMLLQMEDSCGLLDGRMKTLLGKPKIKREEFALLDGFIKREPLQKIEPSALFEGKLFPYQEKGLEWLWFLYQNRWGGILADEMGLGKTIQVLAFLSHLKEKRVLIVAPVFLLSNWKREIEKFLPGFKYTIYAGAERGCVPEKGIVLTSYGILFREVENFGSFEVAILDESSKIKNPSSRTASAAFQIKAKCKINLNATPVENRLDELWSQMHFANPNLVGEKTGFLRESISLIKKKIGPFLLKRTKDEVGLELPPIFEQDVRVQLAEEEMLIYDEYISEAREKGKNFSLLEAILRLRQSVLSPKLLGKDIQGAKFSQLMLDIENISSGSSKVLIFSQFTKMLRLIREEMERKNFPFLYLDGEMSGKEREKVIDRFQKDEGPLFFLMSLKAAGVGLNLPQADYVFIYDPWWNEAVEKQAIGRAHRIGRTKPLIVKRYIANDTIEEKILLLKDEKSKTIEALESGASSMEDYARLLEPPAVKSKF